MECGHLERVENGGRVGFDGEIRLQGVPFTDIGLRQCPDKRGDNSPDYDVWAKGPQGWFAAGKVWVKKMRAGGDMLSLTLDCPTMERPVYVAAFPDDEDQQPKGAKVPVNFTLRWSRPRGGRGSPAQPDTAPIQDRIPV